MDFRDFDYIGMEYRIFIYREISGHQQCGKTSPSRKSVVRRRRQLSVYGQDLEVPEVMVPRLRGVIHAYSLLCSWDKDSKDKYVNNIFYIIGDVAGV